VHRVGRVLSRETELDGDPLVITDRPLPAHPARHPADARESKRPSVRVTVAGGHVGQRMRGGQMSKTSCHGCTSR
jgi:hypothetical protein